MTVVTTNFVDLPQPLQAAMKLPDGARFYRCALQVNPFAYLQRHRKQTPFTSETEYNRKIIEKCLEENIEVIGVTDHYRVKDSWKLIAEARESGIFAFIGFEAVTKDGVHFLCLFDSDKEKFLERYIGDCGIYNQNKKSPIGSLDSAELLERSKEWGSVCIAAHVATKGGLLNKLSGQTRVKIWTSPDLLACALSRHAYQTPEGIRQILKNKDPQHKRPHAMAIISASEVIHPNDLNEEHASCFIKMSDVSVEAFRQAFLDPESRIRLCSGQQPEPHVEILAMAWEGGFLRNSAVRFNGNLNAVVGGRGTGKSTMIESIRYVLGLDPITEDARKAHEGIIRDVLKPGTKISLIARSHSPLERCYLIERTVPNPPIVKDESGKVLSLLPRDVIPDVEVYGQHEISDLAKNPSKLTLLLERFVFRDRSMTTRKSELILEMERSRGRILSAQRAVKALEDKLATLPALEEKEKHFQQAGLEERFKEKSLLIKEERVFSILRERLDFYHTHHENLVENLPFDATFVSDRALAGLPNLEQLTELKGILDSLSSQLRSVSEQYAKALSDAEGAITDVKARWGSRRKAIENLYEQLLRELQESKIDGAEFIQLRRQIEELRPLKQQTERLKRKLAAYEEHRFSLLNEWKNIKAADYRLVNIAAKKVSEKLLDRVRVEVTEAGDRTPLEKLLREIGGNLAPALGRLRTLNKLSLPEFAKCCRKGKESLMKNYGLPPVSLRGLQGPTLNYS